MVALCTTVKFPHGTPPPEAVLDRVRDRTGLQVQLERHSDTPKPWRSGLFNEFNARIGANRAFEDMFALECRLVHTEFSAGCEMVFKREFVGVSTPGRANYLYWCGIAALTDLGGEQPGSLPWYVDLRWSERRWWHRIPR